MLSNIKGFTLQLIPKMNEEKFEKFHPLRSLPVAPAMHSMRITIWQDTSDPGGDFHASGKTYVGPTDRTGRRWDVDSGQYPRDRGVLLSEQERWSFAGFVTSEFNLSSMHKTGDEETKHVVVDLEYINLLEGLRDYAEKKGYKTWTRYP